MDGLVADGNTSTGLQIDGSNFSVTDGQMSSNAQDGVYVSSGSGGSLSRNLACDNHVIGLLVVSSGNTIHDNSGRGNGVSLIDSSGSNDVAPSSTAATATSPVSNILY